LTILRPFITNKLIKIEWRAKCTKNCTKRSSRTMIKGTSKEKKRKNK
jgi:hypothetical protein